MRERTDRRFGMKRKLAAVLAAATGLATLAGCGGGGETKTSGGLTVMTFATAAAAPTPLFQNLYIADKLGYFKAEGIQAKFVNAGGNAAVTTLIAQRRAEVAVGVPNFQVLQAAKVGKLPGINFYEYTYPSKWSLLVAPDSPITSASQLAGKRIGITSRGTADEQVMTSLLKKNGVDPKSVKFQAVGETTAGGLSMNKGDLDANLVWDTTLGAFDVNAIKYKVLIGAKDIEKVGGFFIQASPDYLEQNEDKAVGFARAVAKATDFALANPRAAAAIYLRMFPSSASGKTQEQQIDDIVKTVKYRAERWTPYQDPGKLGFIQPQEFKNELSFAGVTGKISDPAQFYRNDLIDKINSYDRNAVVQQAKTYSNG